MERYRRYLAIPHPLRSSGRDDEHPRCSFREPHPTLSLQLDRGLLCVRVGGEVRWGGVGSEGGYCSRGRHGGALPSMGRAPELRERL